MRKGSGFLPMDSYVQEDELREADSEKMLKYLHNEFIKQIANRSGHTDVQALWLLIFSSNFKRYFFQTWGFGVLGF